MYALLPYTETASHYKKEFGGDQATTVSSSSWPSNTGFITIRQDSGSTSNTSVKIIPFRLSETQTSTYLDSDNTKPLITKIFSFSKMQQNWDGYDGHPPSRKTIEDAITLLKKISKYSLPTRAGLSSDGEVSLIWETEDIFADFGVEGDKTYSYFVETKNNKFYGDEISIDLDIPKNVADALKK
ncbi:hypothetical protein QQM79_19645 [Marinobacteraceae bacterium S3BR75-40.1]